MKAVPSYCRTSLLFVLALVLSTASVFAADKSPAQRSKLDIQGAVSTKDAAAAQKARAQFARLPLSFEANQGQADSRVKFLSRGAGYTLFLTQKESVLALGKNAVALHMK